MLDRACSLSLSLSLSPSFARRGLSTTDLAGEHPKAGYRASSGVTIDPCHLRSVVFMQSAMPRAFRRDTAISRWRRDSAREGEREREREGDSVCEIGEIANRQIDDKSNYKCGRSQGPVPEIQDTSPCESRFVLRFALSSVSERSGLNRQSLSSISRGVLSSFFPAIRSRWIRNRSILLSERPSQRECSTRLSVEAR